MIDKRNCKNNWNKRKIVGIGIITLILLTCTFTIFDSLLGNNEEEEEGNNEEIISKEDAKNYLNQFGYIEKQEGRSYDQKQGGGHRTADQLLEDFSLESLRSAISKFQEFAGLPSTGELDNKTIKKMKKPRCGMQDVEMIRGREEKGTTLMWRKRKLTYRLEHTTNDLPTYMQKKSLQMAFNAWSQYIPLDFEESKSYSGNVDIRVRFARKSHGDPWAFDGKGGVLAHATFPTDGQLHFDDDEHWAFMDAEKIKSYRYTDLFWVSLHEIGHVLGLSHSKTETAIMAPFYKDPSELVDWRNNYLKPELTFDDINAAKNIYGSRGNIRIPTNREEEEEDNDDDIDGLFNNNDYNKNNKKGRKEKDSSNEIEEKLSDILKMFLKNKGMIVNNSKIILITTTILWLLLLFILF